MQFDTTPRLTLADGECLWGEEASLAGKKCVCQPRECTAWWGTWMQHAGTKQCEIANAWGKSKWQLAGKEGRYNVPRALHLLPGKVIRRPPMVYSADRSTASGIPAGSFQLGGEPGTQCEAQRLTVRKTRLCGSVSSNLFSHRHKAS